MIAHNYVLTIYYCHQVKHSRLLHSWNSISNDLITKAASPPNDPFRQWKFCTLLTEQLLWIKDWHVSRISSQFWYSPLSDWTLSNMTFSQIFQICDEMIIECSESFKFSEFDDCSIISNIIFTIVSFQYISRQIGLYVHTVLLIHPRFLFEVRFTIELLKNRLLIVVTHLTL